MLSFRKDQNDPEKVLASHFNLTHPQIVISYLEQSE
jgi:hypothetical protein